ncbi:MAG: mechanosensitive ion channel family protein [Bacteroidia bacterium]|jgi:MscS family membrane protein
MEELLSNNEWINWLWFVGILLTGFVLKRFAAKLVSKTTYVFFKKVSQNLLSDEFVQLLRKPIEQLFTLIILYLAFNRLHFPESWDLVPASQYGMRWFILVVFKIAVLVVVVKIMLKGIDFAALVVKNRQEETSPGLIVFVRELIKIVLMTLALFAGLRFIFNVNITALVASLGIGGLAVALAAQDTLANLLGSFIIYLDSPFKPGDTIEFGDTSGTVEHVGFRSTRIRTFHKSLQIVPNKKIADSILNNITSTEMRRVKFMLNLTYQTTAEQMREMTEELKRIISEHPDTLPNCTVHFFGFGSSSLDILVLYFVNSNEYEYMLRVKEEINLQIMLAVKEKGLEFAFPSQTLYLSKTEE